MRRIKEVKIKKSVGRCVTCNNKLYKDRRTRETMDIKGYYCYDCNCLKDVKIGSPLFFISLGLHGKRDMEIAKMRCTQEANTLEEIQNEMYRYMKYCNSGAVITLKDLEKLKLSVDTALKEEE